MIILSGNTKAYCEEARKLQIGINMFCFAGDKCVFAVN